jgi:hypothetical protein
MWTIIGLVVLVGVVLERVTGWSDMDRAEALRREVHHRLGM